MRTRLLLALSLVLISGVVLARQIAGQDAYAGHQLRQVRHDVEEASRRVVEGGRRYRQFEPAGDTLRFRLKEPPVGQTPSAEHP